MILVTGATGLVGSHLLLLLLEKGEDVRALYNSPQNKKRTEAFFTWKNKTSLFGKINWFHADINDIPALETAFENIKYVYHCAAHISFDPKDEEKLRKVNIEGTANIVNFCIARNIKKLCHVSSIAALGDLAPKTAGSETQAAQSIDEETEWNPEKPHSDYAISKYGAEMEVWRGQQEGLSTVIVNPGIIFGPGFWDSGGCLIFRTIQKGLSFYTKGSAGFVTADDVASIMARLMESPIEKERFVLVAANISFEKLFSAVAATLNKPKPSFYLHPLATSIAWRLDWLVSKIFFRRRSLSRDAAKALHAQDIFGNAKIKNALKYEFESIESYIEATKTSY
ncbi:MAG TPA: NAD-dependent epimerase/dehydratase family protein [Flavobacterium sp.]|nr:NAD-dependent epimerase/dehydratase family protein [Flavobacterium sp.]